MAKDWNKMTIAQLKEELTQRSLDTSGKKADLVSRIESHIQEATAEEEEDQTDQIISEIEEATADANGHEEKKEGGGEEEAAEGEGGDEKKEEEKEDEKKDDEKKDEEKDTKEDNKYPLNVEGRVTYLPWYNNKKIAVPIREQIRHDLTNESKRRSVVMYPVSISDLGDPKLQEYMDRCIHFHVVFQNDWQFKEKTTDGHIGFYFTNASDAEAMASEMEDWREDVHVKHLQPSDNRASLVLEWKGQDPKTSEAVADRMVFVAPLPTDTTEDELAELFPDALRAVIAVDSKGNPKGYGYTEYQNEAAVKEAVDKYKGSLELRGDKLFVYKCCKDKPSGLLSDHVFKACQTKIRNLDMALKRQGRFMNPMEKRNIIKQIRAARQQLNQDMRIRDEMGLPLRLSQQREKERRAEREKQKAEDGTKEGEEKKEGDDKMDDDDDLDDDDLDEDIKEEKKEEKKDEKKTPTKANTNNTPKRQFQNRNQQRGRGNFQRGGGRGGAVQQGSNSGRSPRGGAMAGGGGAMMRGRGRGFGGGNMRQGNMGHRGNMGGGMGQQRGGGPQTSDAIDMLIGLSQALKNQIDTPGASQGGASFNQGGGNYSQGGGNYSQGSGGGGGGGNYSSSLGGDYDERGGSSSTGFGNNQGGGNWGNKRRANDEGGYGGDWKRGPGHNQGRQGGNFGGNNFGGNRRGGNNFY